MEWQVDIMINGLEHVGLCAQNPERLVDWYTTVLRCQVVHRIDERSTYFVRFPGGGMLEVYPATDKSVPVGNLHYGLRHLAISVDDFESDCEYMFPTADLWWIVPQCRATLAPPLVCRPWSPLTGLVDNLAWCQKHTAPNL